MKDFKENIRKFIDKISEIQNNNKENNLSEEQLKEIAFEMGMTEEEWLKVEKTYNDHITRGKGFLKYNNWDDALYEFHQAMTIKPDTTDVLYNIALAYKGRWKNKGINGDQEKAEKYAKQCLQNDPAHQGALHLISTLKQIKKPKGWIWGVLMGLIVIVLVILALLFIPQTEILKNTTHQLEPLSEPFPEPLSETLPEPKELSLNEILAPYITCINRHSGRIYQSYNRYLSWIKDPEKGPVGGVGTVYGLYSIYDSQIHLQNIETMNNCALMYPLLIIKGKAYVQAFKSLKPILTRALDYYETDNYLDDDFKIGQELHGPLVFVFREYILTERALKKLIEELQVDAWQKISLFFTKENSFGEEYQILHMGDAAHRVMLEALALDKDSKKMDIFLKAKEIYEETFLAFTHLAEINKEKWSISGNFMRDYKEFSQILTLYWRAANKGNTRENYRTTTIYRQLIDDYNDTVSSYNTVIESRFLPKLKYLRIKVSHELIDR